MTLPTIKSPTKAEIEASNNYKREREIRRDILKIEETLQKSDFNEMKALHRYLDGKYQHGIADWGKSMYGYNAEYGFSYEFLDLDSIRDNLSAMKPKLEAFIYGWNTASRPSGFMKTPDVNVTVSNTVNISISFEEARKQIEDMSSLTDEQTQEVLERIDVIEQVINSDSSKKSKWEKIKPILAWLADKSYDLGKTILPLLLKIE